MQPRRAGQKRREPTSEQGDNDPKQITNSMPNQVDPELSLKINKRLSELCKTAPRSELLDQMEREFQLGWAPETYLRRAKKAGYSWPGKAWNHVTTEQSEKINDRLRELTLARVPGTEI